MSKGIANSPIEAIISLYDPLQSCSIEYTHAFPNTAWTRRELLVLNSGDYFVKDYQKNTDGPEELDYFVWGQGNKFRTSHGPHGYVDLALNTKYFKDLYALPGPPHHAEDPWPMIARWCRAFAKDD